MLIGTRNHSVPSHTVTGQDGRTGSPAGRSRPTTNGEALYSERRLKPRGSHASLLFGGGELVVLLRFKWEQQSKQAVISVQPQEVSGRESLRVCEFWHRLRRRGQCPPVAQAPPTGPAHSSGTAAP
ncbi:hypothetical protein EYF80_024725 [Liparis tanakae]|uniref:Uncharacterized protein n=1 Tax=Liparis tanakae TaxID=230148 RepID=A0A4Z2HGY0_9TELE|nr:hypothetical protein EYF80_024725 [Liparis tanakae]